MTQAAYAGPAISTAIIMDISAKEAVTDFENLYDAMQHCANGVRWKASVIKYLQNGLVNTDQLRRDLLNGTYKIGKQVKFYGGTPMFKSITLQERLQKAEAENSALRAQLAQTTAQTAYVAMMSDVELPVTTDTANQPSLGEGGEDNE